MCQEARAFAVTPRREPAPGLDARAHGVVLDAGALPAATRAGEHARFGAPVHQPARSGMERQEGAVVPPARVLPPRQVRAGAQPQPVSEGMLVLAPRPQRGADPGGRRFLRRVEVEGQLDSLEVDVDGLLLRAAADVGVRQQRHPHVHGPAAACPDLQQEALHVGLDRIRHLAREHALEVAAREGVLFLVEERPGELQAHPHQLGPVHQDRVQGGDGLVQQSDPIRLRHPGHPRCLDRGQAVKEPYVRAFRMTAGERAQHLERLVRPTSVEQRLSLGGTRVGGQRALGGDLHLECEQEKGSGRQRAANASKGRRHAGVPAWGGRKRRWRSISDQPTSFRRLLKFPGRRPSSRGRPVRRDQCFARVGMELTGSGTRRPCVVPLPTSR